MLLFFRRGRRGENLFGAVAVFDDENLVGRERVDRTFGVVPAAVFDLVGPDSRDDGFDFVGIGLGDDVLGGECTAGDDQHESQKRFFHGQGEFCGISRTQR